jgi:hypothetical protein
MIWPSICVDNFFEDPVKIKKYAYSLKYKENEEGRWPGLRTEPLHTINIKFFNKVVNKILSVIYPMNYAEATWQVSQHFQRIPGSLFKNKGWIHTDSIMELTAIIYLSDHKNCGTSLFKVKNFEATPINEQQKRNFYIKKNINSLKEEKKFLNKNNNQFEKVLEFNSLFNRLVIFDSHQFHAAENFFNKDLNEDRLTLITFFHNINIPNIKYPLTEMRRI